MRPAHPAHGGRSHGHGAAQPGTVGGQPCATRSPRSLDSPRAPRELGRPAAAVRVGRAAVGQVRETCGHAARCGAVNGCVPHGLHGRESELQSGQVLGVRRLGRALQGRQSAVTGVLRAVSFEGASSPRSSSTPNPSPVSLMLTVDRSPSENPEGSAGEGCLGGQRIPALTGHHRPVRPMTQRCPSAVTVVTGVRGEKCVLRRRDRFPTSTPRDNGDTG